MAGPVGTRGCAGHTGCSPGPPMLDRLLLLWLLTPLLGAFGCGGALITDPVTVSGTVLAPDGTPHVVPVCPVFDEDNIRIVVASESAAAN